MDSNLHLIAGIFVYGGLASALIIFMDLFRHPQKMKIMMPVWVLTGLWGSYIGLLFYLIVGRTPDPEAHVMNGANKDFNKDKTTETGMQMGMNMEMHPHMPLTPLHPEPSKVFVSTLHCGAGCSLADLVGEGVLAGIPFVLAGNVWVGRWIVDYILALLFGVLFQYAAIQPMLHLPPGKAFLRAFRIDFLSLTAWQAGMYAWMAVVMFLLFPQGLSHTSLEFWFMMQIAMFFGLAASYPVNWLLIKKGIKPTM